MATACLRLLLPLLLLAGFHLRATGRPLQGATPDLDELEALLERLDDMLPAEDGMGQSQDATGPRFDTGEASYPLSSVDGTIGRPQMDAALSRGSWEFPQKMTPVQNQLRELINAPRSIRRSSGCFGGRLDKIGAQSGLGCNNH